MFFIYINYNCVAVGVHQDNLMETTLRIIEKMGIKGNWEAEVSEAIQGNKNEIRFNIDGNTIIIIEE